MEKAIQPIEMALDAAVLVVRNGGSTVAADRILHRILAAYAQKNVTTLWRLDHVLAISSGDDGRYALAARAMGPAGVNLTRDAEAEDLSKRVQAGTLDAAAFESEIARIGNLPPAYGRWVTLFVTACSGAFFSQIPGGDWGSLGIAFVAVGVGQFVRSILQAKKFSIASTTLICGLISATIACIGLRQGLSQVVPATVIASVMYVVPGLPLINGFIDLVSYKHLFIGIGRIVNALYLFLLLAIAIALALAVIL